MGRPAFRSLLVPLVIVAVAVSAGRTRGLCCAAMLKRPATAAVPAPLPSCCHRHGVSVEGTPVDTLPAPSPCYPGAPCCASSAPMAKPEVARPQLDESRGSFAAIAALVSETPDTSARDFAPADLVGVHASDPPLRVLLCNWRN